MKNISAFLLLVTIFIFIPLRSDAENDFGFSLEPSFGILWGQAEEIVYKNADTGEKLSQLLWDLKPLVYAGMDLEFGPKKPWIKSGFFAEAAIKYGFPLETGNMEDRDWQAAAESYLTNYSKHNAFIQNNGAVIFDFSAGYSWAMPIPVYLRAFADFSYIHLAWNSRDGYLQYPNYPNPNYNDDPWNENLPKFPVYGPAINYEQNWLILSPGLSAGLQGSDYFSLRFFALVSPLIRSVNIDDHLQSSKVIHYEDYLFGGLAFKYGTEISFYPFERWEFLFAADFHRINGSRGSTYKKAGTSNYYSEYKNGGGGGFSMGNLKLSGKYHF
ncbi:outer membrane protease [Spirochaetia bacterium]|nr:outer membrane protease [Spirochaetia bacterium]